MASKHLLAIDFDRTVVNDVTDIVARDLVHSTKIPENVKKLHTPTGWISYMNEIFQILLSNGIGKQDILTAIRAIPEVPGMIKCLKHLHSKNFDLIIISDSNSELINEWITINGLCDYIAKVFTNPAVFLPNGLLHVEPFHLQTECPISTVNLCKGKILQDYLHAKVKQNIIYERVFVVGDGYHDICPMVRLRKQDFACPRISYPAEIRFKEVIEKCSTTFVAQMLYWNDGNDLLNQVSTLMI